MDAAGNKGSAIKKEDTINGRSKKALHTLGGNMTREYALQKYRNIGIMVTLMQENHYYRKNSLLHR